jgi:aspartyl-tRNA(Asn)/glutamyl-tRNA(Gln) amidotransferase subunit B
VECFRRELPELPDTKKARLMLDYGLGAYDAAVLVQERAHADFFERLAIGRDGKVAANWVINELFGRLNKEQRTIAESPVSPDQLGKMLDLLAEGTISGRIAKDLFEILWTEGGEPHEIIRTRGMIQVNDTDAIDQVIEAIIADHPDKVEQLRSKPTLLGWFVGQAMKASGGKANPAALNARLKHRLELD